jgi:hypothetical protein
MQGKNQETYSSQRHGSLQNADDIWINIEGKITGKGMPWGAFKEGEIPVNLRLILEDMYASGEPVPIRVKPDEPADSLTARITNVSDGVATTLNMNRHGELFSADFPPLEAGTYRVQVWGGNAVPVSDVFLVS